MKQKTYNPEESKVTSTRTKQKGETMDSNKNIWKTIRLLQITGLVLATLLLARQNFVYSMVMAGLVALTTAELVFNLVYREK